MIFLYTSAYTIPYTILQFSLHVTNKLQLISILAHHWLFFIKVVSIFFRTCMDRNILIVLLLYMNNKSNMHLI